MVSKLLVSKFPKENPQKMSANQIRVGIYSILQLLQFPVECFCMDSDINCSCLVQVEVKKQTFNKMFADIGIEAPKTDNDNVSFLTAFGFGFGLNICFVARINT